MAIVVTAGQSYRAACLLNIDASCSDASLIPACTSRRCFSSRNTTNSFKVIASKEETLGERVWREYGKAVERRDLKKALRILETVQVLEESRDFPFADKTEEENDLLPFRVKGKEDDDDLVIPSPTLDLRNLLDTCLSATDMRLVATTYNFLQLRGLLPSFGRYKNITAESSRDVTPAAFLEAAGLEASKLSPQKWGLAGNSAVLLAGAIVGFNFLVNNGIDVRPLLASILAFTLVDAIYLGGTGLASVLISWPPYKRRVLVHEAGHVLVAYLLGCPVRGVILDPIQAMKLGIQGQAGTQFWDETLEEELRQGRLTNASLDRYSMVLFAGIAAEALVYGEAKGGENDENLFKAIVSILRPPWSASQISNQARWAVLQSFKMLREHRKALDIVVRSLYEGETLGTVVRDLEAVLSSVDPIVT